MVRKGFAVDGEANKGQTGNGSNRAGPDDSLKRNALRGFTKFAVLIFLFIAVMLIRIFIVDVVTVSGDSMVPSFVDGDILLLNKRDSLIARYDVVVVRQKHQKIIKRVIGLPGETISIVDGDVFVDGIALEGEYAFITADGGVASTPYTLGDDEYFLMGDNRSGSADSRMYGAFDDDSIKGVVTYRLFPLDITGAIPHGKK